MYPWDDERGLLVAYVNVIRPAGLWGERVGVVTIVDLGEQCDAFAWSAFWDAGGCAGQGTATQAAEAGALGFAALGGEVAP